MSKILVLDPGHGEPLDPGAVGPTGLKECDVAYDLVGRIAKKVAACSGPDGYGLIMPTRNEKALGDTKVEDLLARCEFANLVKAHLFVSVHCNAAEDPRGHGFEVFTSPGWTRADAAASLIWYQLRKALPDRRARADMSDGDPDKESKFVVLMKTEMPAVLVETAFVSNPEEEALLRDEEFLDKTAQAVAAAILEFSAAAV